jgi:hypothetical protein
MTARALRGGRPVTAERSRGDREPATGELRRRHEDLELVPGEHFRSGLPGGWSVERCTGVGEKLLESGPEKRSSTRAAGRR